MSEIPICRNDETEMSEFYDPYTNQTGWICDECGWYFLEEEVD